MENLAGKLVEVLVSKNGKMGSKIIKVCKVKARSVLFIEVDKQNRKNIFWKVNRKHIESAGERTTSNGHPIVVIIDGVLLSENKWESPWDAIGNNPTPSYARPFYSNHSKGWAPKLPSTTNSAAGFPMV